MLAYLQESIVTKMVEHLEESLNGTSQLGLSSNGSISFDTDEGEAEPVMEYVEANKGTQHYLFWMFSSCRECSTRWWNVAAGTIGTNISGIVSRAHRHGSRKDDQPQWSFLPKAQGYAYAANEAKRRGRTWEETVDGNKRITEGAANDSSAYKVRVCSPAPLYSQLQFDVSSGGKIYRCFNSCLFVHEAEPWYVKMEHYNNDWSGVSEMPIHYGSNEIISKEQLKIPSLKTRVLSH
jgi:hypothetical protein